MTIPKNESRSRMVSLLRGQVACPLIASLAELDIAEQMLEGPFRTSDFTSARRHDLLHYSFAYLESIGLLRRISNEPEIEFALTEIGRTVFKRAGAFSLLASYRDYFGSLTSLLAGVAMGEVSVDRRLNVLGSGSLHSRKFFPAVRDIFLGTTPGAVVDVGCGDGTFLDYVLRDWPTVVVAAIDSSAVAIEASLARIQATGKQIAAAIVCDAADVKSWTGNIPDSVRGCDQLTISMWFVAHEISAKNPAKLANFFKNIHYCLPKAGIIIGEIVNISPEILAENNESSIMPEFLFFHELSGQGVLSWEQWKSLLTTIPYRLAFERRFDEVENGLGGKVPSSFVWHLTPL